MAGRSLGSLTVDLIARIGGFEQGMTRAARVAEDQSRRIERTLRGMRNAMTTAFGVLGVAGLGAFARSAIETADELQKLSRQVEVGVESLQGWRYAFEQIGLGQNQFDMALQRLQRRLGEFQRSGGGPAAAAIRELGLEAAITSGRIRTTEQAFRAIADAMRNVNDNARATSLSHAFFDDVGRMAPLLRQGSAAIDEAARKLPALISRERAREAELLTTAFGRMSDMVGTSLKNSFIAATAEAADFFGVIDRELHALETLGEANARVAQTIASIRAEMERIASVQVGVPDVGRLTELQEKIDRLQRLESVGITPFGERAALRQQQVEAEARSEFQARFDALQKVMDEFSRQRLPELRRPKIELLPVVDVEAQIRAMEQEAARIVDATRTPLERYEATIARLNELADAGALDWDTYGRAVEQAKETLKALSEEGNLLGESLGRGLHDSLVDWMTGVETNFARMIQRMAIHAATSQLFNFLGGLSGDVGKAFRFLGFGGPRAAGGPVSPGLGYLVGERGPEYFVPSTAGRIVPNGGGGMEVTIINNSPGVDVQTRQSGPDALEIVINAVGSAMATGRMDPVLAGRYGIRPTTGLR